MQITKMTPKDEFYQLISSSFTPEQIATIQEEITNLEEKGLMKDDAAYYYDLCSLYYTLGKNFRNFVENLDNRRQSADRLKYFEQEDLEKKEKGKLYQSTYNNFEDWLNNEPFINAFRDSKEREACTTALTNAVNSELEDIENLDKKYELYEDYQAIKDITESLKSGGQITKIRVWSDCVNYTIKHKELYSNLWMSFFNSFTNTIIKSEGDVERIKEDYKNRKSKTQHRIALRICKVLVRYNVMKETTKSNRHVLKNESGEYVQLPSEIMTAIYDVLETLGVTWEIRRTAEEKEKYKTDDTKLTKNQKANLIMSLIRGDKKYGGEPVNPIEDNFDYKDIRDDYLGDLVDTGFVI